MVSTLSKITKANLSGQAPLCLLIFTLFLLLTSCQTTLRLLESDKEEQYLNLQEESNYCTGERNLEFSSDHPFIIDLAVSELTPRYEKGLLSFREIIQVYALLHLMIAPDRFGPAARFQYLLSDSVKSNVNYQDTFAKDPLRSHSSFLLAIKSISPNTLQKSIELAVKIAPVRIPVDKKLAHFLEENKTTLITLDAVRANFFKGELPLQEGESFPKITITELRNAFRKLDQSGNYYQSNFLFDSKAISEKSTWSCSFDIGIYTNSIYLVRNEQPLTSGLFGVRARKGQWFLASGVFNPQSLETHPQVTSWWRAADITPPAAMCFKKEGGATLALASTQDRDPGQHLFHLIELEKKGITDLTTLKTYIDFTRYLILFSPERIVLESRRASKEQIENYLRLPIPLYHAERLGKIWGYGEFEGQTELSHGFVIDGREEGHLSCNR